MNVWTLARKEIGYRKLNFALATLATAIAAATFLGTAALLRGTNLETGRLLDEKVKATQREMGKLADQIRVSMKGMGFNLHIFPEGQDMGEVYEKGYATKTMPESYATRLANANIVTINHLLPMLTQVTEWPEYKRKIVLIGIRGEVPRMFGGSDKASGGHKETVESDPLEKHEMAEVHKAGPKGAGEHKGEFGEGGAASGKNGKQGAGPLINPVKKGGMIIGYELQHSLGLKVGDRVKLKGHDFTIQTCYGERGSKDDITVWINLDEAQAMFGKKGRINDIMALECNCQSVDRLGDIRADLEKILPGTQVMEVKSKALARAEARTQVGMAADQQISAMRRNREQLQEKREAQAAVLIPLIGIICLGGIGLLTFINTRDRRYEVGLLLALGVTAPKILAVFLLKAALSGLLGGLVGIGVSLLLMARGGSLFSGYPVGQLASMAELGLVLIGMPLFAVVAAWLPAFMAAQDDPAEVLRND